MEQLSLLFPIPTAVWIFFFSLSTWVSDLPDNTSYQYSGLICLLRATLVMTSQHISPRIS
jgi:hypothetical protein